MIDLALSLASASRAIPPPNPAVGCVITDPSGRVIGRGHTQLAGGHHAEVMALLDAEKKGNSTQGSTVYVTLEPCSHQGRTAPCCDALIAAGVIKVVASIADPNPLVAGKGFARLRAAGVLVEVGPGAAQSLELNVGFFSRMIRNIPWVRLKVAASLDGKIALQNGFSQWITSELARIDGHRWRARACAILTGVGTVRLDNPSFDVRHVITPRQPHLVVIDSRMDTPLDAKLFLEGRKLLVYAAVDNSLRKTALESRGAEVILMPSSDKGDHPKVDLHGVMRNLAMREINEVHVEAGQKLNASLIEAGLVDEFLYYLAPKIIGIGQSVANTGPHTELIHTLELKLISVDRVGPDLRIIARPEGRGKFLESAV